MKPALAAALLVLVIVCLILAALCLRASPPGASGALAGVAAGLRPSVSAGGALRTSSRSQSPRRTLDPAKSAHVVVDTLNLVHWLFQEEAKNLTLALITRAIDATAPTLKLQHPGVIVYVIKDRESKFNDDAARAEYKRAADRNRVHIALTERYPDPPAGTKPSAEHSAQGRDDFYMSVLARRFRCAVLTADRLKDFDRFRATIPPFHVYEYFFWRDLPHRVYIRPDSPAFAQLRKPRTIHPRDVFESRPGA